MIRAAAVLVAVVFVPSMSLAQDAATRKAVRAIHAQEKEVLRRVTQRLEYDKKLDGSTVRVEVQPGGVVTLSGSVMSEGAKLWAVDLVENTTGVTSVVDELAVARAAKVHDARTTTPTIEVERPVAVPSESRVISKP